MHEKKIITGGKKIEEADKVLIMLHGRGGACGRHPRPVRLPCG